ncbi:tRNA (N6-isopentenyl adenosine(37)-C2)-methylthiotransferase MiaB [Fodinibius sp. SL11]|uniref:tRNA (N6-isopentenyl adenosine(37)-C2)-methylthiotransferase MiaB n=1 Tax=Fodinibius sp. SL11 TaxID=3425690 RepID=UPI003F8846D1
MDQRNFYIETYGCQMNVSDTEIVNSILMEEGMQPVNEPEDAEVIFINTCSIRDNAEERVWNRLKEFKAMKRERQNHDMTVGVLGCMAERIREKIMEKEELVDLVVGPDAYRDLPKLLSDVDDGQKAANTILSLEETYADIKPVRRNDNGVSAFVTIMRGCDNMCAFCVVPFTRGRERSRTAESIIEELQQLSDQGYKEVTLLGQNVNSYDDGENSFADLMYKASQVDPEMRIRFSSPHPKDFPEELLEIIAEQPNLCNYIHIPAQSGNNDVLERMRRPYTREQYLDLVKKMRDIIPGVTLSTDIITGFCGETEEEHEDTMSLMAEVKYDLAYMFAYSERGRTLAQRKYEDDVPEDVKKRRLSEIIEQQMNIQEELNKKEIGRRHLVLVEGTSKRSDEQLCGRTDTNKMVVFDREDHLGKGDYVEVTITDCTSATLMGDVIKKSSIQEYSQETVAA